MVRIFLGLSAIVWLSYGVFCFFQPGALVEIAGVSALSTTASVELRAMYGGLQAAIGAFAALAVFQAGLRRPALLAIAFLCSGLGLARLLGVLLEGELSSYNAAGLGFELVSATVAIWLTRRDAPLTAGAPG